LVLISCNNQPTEKPIANQFVTWKGIGPDKWASIWLIKTAIDPNAQITFIEIGEKPTSGTPFDIPTAPPYIRTGQHTTYETLTKGFQITDTTILEVGKIIRDIEIDAWAPNTSEASAYLEDAFRGLQFTYGRENVPMNCYLNLFSNLQSYIATNETDVNGEQLQKALAHNRSCASSTKLKPINDEKYVSEWRPEQILGFIDAGDKVVFIDTRETDEFEEGHIPGAINIKLRELDNPLPKSIAEADVVIPYCVKDFRGFEVAKKLKLQGIEKVGLMNPWGISGWKATGLPVTGTKALTLADAQEKLKQCANKPTECINNG